MNSIRISKKALSPATSRLLACPIRTGQLQLAKLGHHNHQPQLPLRCGNLSLRNFAASSIPPSSYEPAHPPILFDLVLRSDWKSALKRVSSHPIEARYRHPRGYTLLHCAVEYGAPVELIDMMAKAHPEALEMKDWQGRSIVDIAIENDTKVFLEKLAQNDLQQTQQQKDVVKGETSEEVGSNLSLTQMEAISKQLLEIETSCHRLRIQLDENGDTNNANTGEAIRDAEIYAITQSIRAQPGAFPVEGFGANSPTVEEEEKEGSDHGQQPENEADEEVCRIPSAYLVEEDEDSFKEIAQAEKVEPYFQRREGQLTIAIVGGLMACLAIVLGVFLSRKDNVAETPAIVKVTDRPTSATTLDQRPTLTIVRERGVVNCGIEDVNREGGINLGEYNIDQCRAPTKMELVIVGADDRYERLLNHEVDVLFAGDSFTLEKLVREPSTGELGKFAFGYPYYTDSVVYFGLETYVKCAEDQKRYEECVDLSICAVDTPEIRPLITSFFPPSFIRFGPFPEMESSLKNETGCNVLVSDLYRIYGSSTNLYDDMINGKYVGSTSSVFRATQIGLWKDESECPANSTLTNKLRNKVGEVPLETISDISFHNAPYCLGNGMEAFRAHLGNTVVSLGPDAYLPSIDAPNFGSLECDNCEDVLRYGKLKVIKERGMLNCAVYVDPMYNLTRTSLATLVNVKFCEILSVAIFQGKPDAVNITYIDELDYSSFPQEYDIIAGGSWEARVGFDTTNLGTMSMSYPYYTHDKYFYIGTMYSGVGRTLSFTADNEDRTLLLIANAVVIAAVNAQRNGITKATYFDMPLMHLWGDSLTFMFRDMIMHAGNYDDIINEALALSDGGTGKGWNTVFQNYGAAAEVSLFWCDYVGNCPPCQWVEVNGGYVCIHMLP
ncbi:hypothetical protein ACHAWT_009945 [Skeletonema menzelii]